MAVDKLVDSSKLNAALDYEAGKIIAKGGGTAPLAFDFANEKGFGDYIDAIPSGGGLPSDMSYSTSTFIPAEDIGSSATGYIGATIDKIISLAPQDCLFIRASFSSGTKRDYSLASITIARRLYVKSGGNRFDCYRFSNGNAVMIREPQSGYSLILAAGNEYLLEFISGDLDVAN